MEDKNNKKKSNLNGWQANTELSVNLKTILRSDKRTKTNKSYPGILRLDSDAIDDEFLCRDPHYTFTEIVPKSAGRRNPHLFDGQFVTITLRDNGSLRPNLKQMPKLGANMSVDDYTLMVYRELRQALGGLVEE